ncbi:HNH endonuclease [Staphylococcus hominis]|uniref:HNH endonuclease n=1 Tax=Staphylococcus hominis TaxID=1290 RepID=UPI001F55CFA9|nr:NUMOD4 domain-containing protein [Staphylococcus hominis]MCI2919085.1 HNH endonuclease [Staphylococcus hominis]MDS3927125.1 NUMOD4 domain-containing protein [Staphylococcus hominis]
MEEWKYIKGTDDMYMISNKGRVKSLYKNIIRKTNINKGYEMITIHIKGKIKSFSIHRLVAEAFIPNPENKPQINHIDENKLNNDVSNLMWCTAKDNANWGTRNERIREFVLNNHIPRRYKRNVNFAPTKKVAQIDKGTKEVIKVFDSITLASKTLGIGQSNISDVCRGVRKTTGGYIWKLI